MSDWKRIVEDEKSRLTEKENEKKKELERLRSLPSIYDVATSVKENIEIYFKNRPLPAGYDAVSCKCIDRWGKDDNSVEPYIVVQCGTFPKSTFYPSTHCFSRDKSYADKDEKRNAGKIIVIYVFPAEGYYDRPSPPQYIYLSLLREA